MPVRQLIAAFTLMAMISATLWGAGPQQRSYVGQQPMNRAASTTNGSNVSTVGISVMGQVTRPAAYSFNSANPRMVDVLAAAGGLTPGSNQMVRIVRNGQIVGRVFVTERTNETVYPGDLLIADSRQASQRGMIVESPQVGAAGQFQPMRVSDRKAASQVDEMQMALIGLRDYPVVLKVGKQHASVTQMLASLGQNPNHPVEVVSTDSKLQRSADWRKQLLPAESVLIFDSSKVIETSALATLPRPLVAAPQAVAQAIGKSQNGQQGTQDVTHATTFTDPNRTNTQRTTDQRNTTGPSAPHQPLRREPAALQPAPLQKVEPSPARNSPIRPVADNSQYVELPAPPALLTQVPLPVEGPIMEDEYIELPAPDLDPGEEFVVTRPLGQPLADASGGNFAGMFTPLKDLRNRQMTPLSELPDYPSADSTTALASTLNTGPGNVEAASTSLISVVVGLVGFLVAGSAGIILVSMARKANRSQQRQPEPTVIQPSASTVLDDLIQDRIPRTEEATALPKTMKFFGHPTGPQKIRIDARHEMPAPHFETTVRAGGNSPPQGQTTTSHSSGSQMRFDSDHPQPTTTSTSRQHQTSRVLDRVLSSVNERGATQQ